MTVPVRGMTPLIQVFDMPASLQYYRDRLGFEVAQSDGPGEPHDWALLRLGDAHLMLNTAYEADSRPPAPDPTRVSAHGDTTVFFGCPDVDGAYRHFVAQGVTVTPPVVTHSGFKSISLTDPDGYVLCFHWPATEGS